MPAAVIMTLTPLAEAEAVQRVKNGDRAAAEAAFRSLYDAHAPFVHRFVRRLLGDAQAAEDVVQETFVKLHRNLAGFDAARPLRPYVLAIARNTAIDLLRAREHAARPDAAAADAPSPDGDALDHAARAERRDLVQEALAALDADDRAILLLRHFAGLKVDAIAEVSGTTTRTAFNRLRAAGSALEVELRRRGVLGEGGTP